MDELSSRLPPRTLAKLRSMMPSDAKVYASELLSSYELSANRIKLKANAMARQWASRQVLHFELVKAELQYWIKNGEGQF